MAELNPLAFKVAVQDEATGQLNKIEQQFDKLKDKTISVKVEGLSDLQNLLSALQHQQVQNLGKDVASGIHDAAKGLQEEAQKAVRASLGKLAEDLVAVKTAIQHDNFSAFTTRIEKCAEAVNTLDAAFKQFHVTIGSDAGMKNFMTGLGEVIRNVRTTMGTLHGSDTAKITPDAMARSFKVAKHEAERLQNELVRAQRTIETFGDKGFNVASLERYKMALLEVRDNLDLIKKNGGMHPLTGLTASQYLSSEDASRVVSLMKTELSYYQNIGKELERIAHLRSTLTSVMQANPSSPYRGELFQAIAGLDLREGLLARQGARDATQTLNSDAYRQQIQEAVSLISKVSAESRNSAKENAQMIESMRRAGIAVSDLAAKFDRLEIAKIRANAVAAKVDTTAYDQAVERMERYKRVLDYIAQHGGHDAGRITGSVGYRNAANDLNVQATALRALTTEANKAAHATQQLSAEEQRLSQALQQTNDHARGQSQLLSDLKSLATQYLSVWGAKTILDNIIQTGGLLEQQRMSIGAILGDMSQANALFEQIKSLAIRSPFGVVQLDTMSKQLTAYDFNYNEIYDWVKRIGDISAATGTEASRLALALGHVKSEGALTGYTLRQFAMGNVPLLATLAKQLGRTTAEIRKMTKEKAISYDDVVVALKSMTEGNGLFANAQETMSQALNAKFKNLRDAFDLMWGDVAESGVGDALKALATSLTDLTKHWKPLVADLAAGAATFGALKAATLFWNTSLGQSTASTIKQALALKQQEVAQLRVAQTYRTLTTVEKIKMATAGKLNAYDLRLLINTQKITSEELLRAVAMGKVNKQMAMSAVQTSRLDAATKQLVISQLQSLNGLRRGAIMWATFTNSIKSAAFAIGGFLKSMAPMAAMMVISDAWMSKKADEDAFKDRLDSMKEKANEGYRNLQDIQKQYPVGGGKGMDNTLLSQSIDEMVEKLKDYSATANMAFNNAFQVDKEGKAVHTLSEQYDILAQALADTTEAYKTYHDLIPQIEHALKVTEPDKNFLERMGDSIYGWMLDDNTKAANSGLTTVLENYCEKVKEATVAENLFLRQRLDMAAALKSLGYEGVYEMENEELLHLINTMKNEAPETFTKFYQIIDDDGKNALNGMTMAWRDMNEAVGLANLRMRKVGQDLYESMKVVWGEDMQKWPSNWREIVMIAMNNATADVKEFADLSEDYQNYVRNSFLKPFKIEVDTDEAHDRVNNLLVDLENLVGRDWTIKIGIKGEDSFADVDAAQKAYKDAQEKIKDAEGRLKKLGNPTILQTNLTEQQRQTIQDYNYQIERRNKARTIIESYGGTPEEPKEKKTTTHKPHSTRAHKEDALAKMWQNRVEILKKYRSELEKYEKVMSREQAIEKLKTNGNFAPMFNEKWFTNPNDFTGSIDEAIRKLGSATDRRKELVARWGADKEDFLGDKFRNEVELAVNELGRLMGVMAENYQTYKKWVDLTGNADLAAQIAGVAQNSSMAGWLTERMNEQLTNSGDSHSAADVFSMSESEVAKFGENSAIFKLWDEWQENNKKVKKENLDLYAEAIKNAKGYAEKVADINRELEREIAAIKEMTGGDVPTEAQQSQRTALIKNATDTANKKIADETWNNFKATEEWGRIFADLDRISTGTLTRMLAKLREIAPTLNGSVESTKAVYEAIDRVTNVVNGRNPFKAISESLGNRSALSGYYKQAKKEGNLVANAELSKLLGVKLGSTVTKDQIKDGMKNESEDFKKAIGKVVDGLQTFQNGLNLVSSTFDALGMEGAANAAGDAAGILGGAMQGAQSLSALGPWGMAAGAALGLVSGIAQTHDKALERQIGKLREDVQKIEANTKLIEQARERTFGYDNGNLRRTYSQQYAANDKTYKLGNVTFSYKSDAQKAMYEYYRKNSAGSGYQQQLANLKAEREDYLKMYDAENDKKKKSNEALEEYKSKIAELDDQIRYFAEDIANELWSIDIKGWADQFSDAFMTAFENGENMMKAFDDTAKSIMQSVVKEMLKIGIIEPMIANLRNKLFGYTDDYGKFHAGVVSTDELTSDPVRASQKVLATMGEYFKPGGEGSNMMVAAKEYLTGIDGMMRQMGYANGLGNNESSNTLSASIQGMTEETSDLFAGYVNALRQDVAIKRILLTQFVTELWPSYIEQVSQAIRALNNIDTNVAAIRALLSENGTIYLMIDSMRSHFDNITNGNEQVNIR